MEQEENSLITLRSLTARQEFVQFITAFLGLITAVVVILAFMVFSINSNLRSRTIAEEKLKNAEQEALLANKELESFSYSVSHDLRAPLRSIDGYTQILKDDYADKLDEEGNRLIGIVTGNAKRMGQLIDDLLDFSRVGRQEIKKTVINMDEFVKPIITELTEFQKNRDIRIDLKTLGSGKGDVSMLRQVWVNLLSNAIKYTGKRDIAQIEVGRVEKEGDQVFYVRDNGVGFDMQYSHKLFGVFQRLHKPKDFEGTGVGLALVKRIIERHNGTIWAESQLNEGTTFYFSLPN
jgi:light-regulated signal transduction histidine kinase (bacteriophytochrome)